MDFDRDIDISLLEINLKMSPEEKLKNHQSALDLVWLLQEAAKNEKSKPTTSTSSKK